MSHGRNPGYEPGNHWVVCDVCGFDYRVDKIKERWDGLMVCPQDYELRHPQDFVRSMEEDNSAKGPVRTPPEPEYVRTVPQTDPDNHEVPSGTFNEDTL